MSEQYTWSLEETNSQIQQKPQNIGAKEINQTALKKEAAERKKAEMTERFKEWAYEAVDIFDGKDEELFNFLYENYLDTSVFDDQTVQDLKLKITKYLNDQGIQTSDPFLFGLTPFTSTTGRKIFQIVVSEWKVIIGGEVVIEEVPGGKKFRKGGQGSELLLYRGNLKPGDTINPAQIKADALERAMKKLAN